MSIKNVLAIFVALVVTLNITYAPLRAESFDYGKASDDIKLQVKKERSPSTAALISYFLFPGIGDMYIGDWGRGSALLGTSLGLLFVSLKYDEIAGSGELNVPSLFYSKWREICTFSVYQSARKKYNNVGYSIPYDETSIQELLIAPFKPKYIFRPGVLLSIAVAAGVSILQAAAYESRGMPYSDVNDITIAGNTFDRTTGTLIHETMWGVVSLGAGVGEELLFRGVLQSEITNHTNPLIGLLCASGIFGMIHLANPGRGQDYLYPVVAGLAGAYFGALYIKNDYKLSESIAAHFWWDFAVGTVWFFMDPEHNPIGARINLSF